MEWMNSIDANNGVAIRAIRISFHVTVGDTVRMLQLPGWEERRIFWPLYWVMRDKDVRGAVVERCVFARELSGTPGGDPFFIRLVSPRLTPQHLI